MRPTKSAELASKSTRDWWRCPGIVYFLTVGSPAIAVKIGMFAITPKTDLRSAMIRRLSSIQSSNHELVEIYRVIHFSDGDFPTKAAEDFERQMHNDFRYLARFKPGTRGSEWFTVTQELLARINDVAVPPEALDLPKAIGVPHE
jgi:hypothetical protein